MSPKKVRRTTEMTITLNPRWEGLLRWMLHAMRDPKLDAQVREVWEAEIVRLGREVDKLNDAKKKGARHA